MDYLAYVTNNGAITAVQRQQAALGPTDVRVAVDAASLNFRDLILIHGTAYRAAVNHRVPLSDAVGIVTAVGERVTRFQPGERVVNIFLPGWIDGPLTAQSMAAARGSKDRDGVLAEQITVDQQELVAVPEYLDQPSASTLAVAALTAWHAVAEIGALKAGDTLVVQTTGGVSVFAIQFAVAMGARVIVVSRSDAKLERALGLGASVAIDSVRHPAWEQQVLRHTEGIGAQLVLDMGLADSLRQSVRAAAYEGTVAVIGVVQQDHNMLDLFPMFNKNLRLRGVETGSRAMFERMLAFMARHAIVPVVDSEFDVADMAQALRRLQDSPFGKVVVNIPKPAIPHFAYAE